MKITVAKTAGFCFGVNRAVEIVEKCLLDKDNTYHTLGPIIHNKHVVDEFSEKGISPIASIDEAKSGEKLIIRTHGVGKEIYDALEERGIDVIDVTCPFVKKIHNIVNKHYKDGYKIVIVGDKNHPEVKGINGWCENTATIFATPEEAEDAKFSSNPVCVVAQTTFVQEVFKKIVTFLKKTCNDIVIFDTICNATEERQK